MGARSDVWLTWFKQLLPASPMLDPRLDIHELQDPHPFKVAHGNVLSKCVCDAQRIDDPVRRQATAEQAIADWKAKMIEEFGRKSTRATLDPPLQNAWRKVICKGAPRE